ncbi:methyltransferase domain-containing protein, partial [Roseisolibacter sp. H3M3-2]|uniref:methyltransferase domain-containing protein n=1 Tax=Roseisolibacter sp. H3M3-2 TaxID=3031323 RepID=UPI0023DABDAF
MGAATEAMDYHLAEFEIALDPRRPEHLMPPLGARHRRVLDVGCGAGQTLAAAAVLHPAAGRLACGVDVVVASVAAGRARWPALALAAARDEALPYGDASFDLVFSRVALPYMHVGAA